MICTRCSGTGFLNIEQIDGADDMTHETILVWMAAHDNHDVQVCDCCGDGDDWYGDPGEHNEQDFGDYGPYAYNGGLPECY